MASASAILVAFEAYDVEEVACEISGAFAAAFYNGMLEVDFGEGLVTATPALLSKVERAFTLGVYGEE